MRYPLETKNQNALQSLLQWIYRYLRFKSTTLSNRLIKDRDIFYQELENLQSNAPSITALETTIKSIRNAGLNGIITYGYPLIALYHYLEKKPNFKSLKEIDEVLLSDFLAIVTSSLSPQTRKNYRISLINFFSFIDKNQIQKDTHIFKIELKISAIKKYTAKLPAYLQESEIEKFLKSIELYPFSSNVAARDKVIIKLIIYTGIRVSEALFIHRKDLHFDGDLCVINIIGKGNKNRIVAIKTHHIQEDLRVWLIQRNKIQNIQEDFLFCNQKGSSLSQAYIYRSVEKILLFAGIKKQKMGAHMLRHSFATLLYQKHKDLVLVQEALGHADLNTSRIYTHFDQDQIKKTASLMDHIHHS